MKKNKGFTLPEVMVSLLIGVLVAAVAGATIVFGLNLMVRNGRLYLAKQIGDGVQDVIINRISLGTELTVSDEFPVESTSAVIFIPQNGRPEIISADNSNSGRAFFTDEFYHDARINVTLSQDFSRTDVVEVSVEVWLDGSNLYTRTGFAPLAENGIAAFDRFSYSSFQGGYYIS